MEENKLILNDNGLLKEEISFFNEIVNFDGELNVKGQTKYILFDRKAS